MYIYIYDISSLRVNQLLYCVSLKIYNKFANYFCELKFSTNTQITDFKKIRRVVAEFHADRRRDGRTDITKLTVAFHNFANAPKYLIFHAGHL